MVVPVDDSFMEAAEVEPRTRFGLNAAEPKPLEDADFKALED